MKFSSIKKQAKSATKRGFTLVEMLVVLVLLGVVFQISITAFFAITKQQNLDKDVENAYSYLLKARNQTLNGEANSVYGVRFATTSVSLFKGPTYNTASTTSVYSFVNKSYVSTISLTGGTYDVIFSRISGNPSATGTVMYKIGSLSTVQKTIIIHGSGLVEVQ